MKSAWAFSVAASLLPCVVPVSARADSGEVLETIVVTGSRIGYRDLLDTPAVSITRPGDFLMLSLTLVNDTRNEQARESEIYATLQKMLARAGKRFELVYGESFTTRIDESNVRIPLSKDEKRPDVEYVELFVRTALAGQPGRAAELTLALRDFVKNAERVGRTEIDVGDEPALSLARPERFRYELIDAIAKDTAAMRTVLGSGCEMTIEGLSSRIEWQRVSVSELLLYIPYTMEISRCGVATATQ